MSMTLKPIELKHLVNHWRLLLSLCLSLSPMALQAACPSTSGRFVVGTTGNEVLDTTTGLVWKRCPEGQTWNGTGPSDGTACTGTPTLFTFDAAFGYAKPLNGWRLPNIRELQTLIDNGCSNPAINPVFPSWVANPSVWQNQNEPAARFWSSTPTFTDLGYAGAWAYFGFDDTKKALNNGKTGSIFSGASFNYSRAITPIPFGASTLTTSLLRLVRTTN